ncbi:hypothetical protein ACOME3_004574 [Neoechinorhynchus agilis]
MILLRPAANLHSGPLDCVEQPMHPSFSCARGCIDCRKKWYCQILDYNFSIGKYSLNTTSFTQMVWKSSRSVGFGVGVHAHQTKYDYYVQTLFSPLGNIENNFFANVLPTKFDYKSYCGNEQMLGGSLISECSGMMLKLAVLFLLVLF